MSTTSRRSLLPIAGLAAGFLVLGALTAILVVPHAGRAPAGVGGPFALTSQDGKPLTEKALRGHPTLIFFGYTHCPDVCPTTLAQIAAVFKAIGPDNKAQALFITVDPQRDTPAVMKDYVASFGPNVTGLTGSPAEIKKVESEYKAYSKAVPDKDGAYTVDHTAITYLMDRTGTFVGAFNLDRPAPQAAAELKQYF